MNKTKLTLKITGEIIEQYWPLTNVQAGEILSQSGERIVGALSAHEGNFVYKIADPSKTEAAIQKDTFAFDFLSRQNWPHIPKLLSTREDGPFQVIDDKFVYVMERVEGKAPERNPATWQELGRIAASLHEISGYPYQSSFTVESEIARFEEIASKVSFGSAYLEVARSLNDFGGLSQTLIHTDIGPHNSVQKQDGTIVLTDWDDVGIGTTILDLGFPLICHFVTEDLKTEEENARAFYASYFSHRSIPEREKDLIFDAGLLYALAYVPYGNTEKHWERIKFATEHKALISGWVR
ncbi:hypothetical protein C4552_00380 [Candidatus Parcubacteria bacterium]|nr:MAG: hypothetical protein C4552_00380 [Candidatus Parcubacteria bacterium]